MEAGNNKLVVQKRYMSTAELAEYLGKSRWWIYGKIKRRQIPFIPVGRDLRFDVKVIDGWMAKKAVGTM